MIASILNRRTSLYNHYKKLKFMMLNKISIQFNQWYIHTKNEIDTQTM